jgi:hypothetical protein
MQAWLVYSPGRQFFNLIPKHIVPLYRLGTCQINVMEMAVRDWLRMQESALRLNLVVVGQMHDCAGW